MSTEVQNVVLLGGTGRTGSRVLERLAERGVPVRAIVRDAAKVPAALRSSPAVTVIEADLLSLDDATLRRHLQGCTAVVSCLGHTVSFRGIFGRPRDLVTRAARRVCDAITALEPAAPVKVAWMSSVSVNRPDHLDARRGAFERAAIALLRLVLPPARDNQTAVDVFTSASPAVEWVVVRPDSLLEGDVSEYALHDGLVASIFKPDHTRMANVAHFLADLATDPRTWERWRGRMPVIVDAVVDSAPHAVGARPSVRETEAIGGPTRTAAGSR